MGDGLRRADERPRARRSRTAGLGTAGDADHFDEFICFYLIGENVRDLASAAREVLVRHGLRAAATGFLTNPDAEDGHGTPIAL